ncbi:MAG: GDSL-type esterase/lipase family protein [Anaerolineae bacterium]|nr:GDSL-type esterase/lipase family protein [Thermoflexales bacterium]MDW8407726.1 GDSL-type esterase/lipase family protein [Anaerolineae bacterium]
MSVYSPEQLAYLIQFIHPQKTLGALPQVGDEVVAAAFGLDVAEYRRIRGSFTENARRAAQALLQQADFAARVARLPFARGCKVVALGDSITDDDQSWAEILRHVLALARPDDTISVINAGVSGHTTSDVLARFLGVVNEQPDWIICMIGTNDARRHGLYAAKTMISPAETERNFAALRQFARAQTSARWVWMTPATVIEEKIAADWWLGQRNQITFTNADLRAVADIVRRQPDSVVDLQVVFGTPANPQLLLSDGLHPSLAGQIAIVTALVQHLSP